MRLSICYLVPYMLLLAEQREVDMAYLGFQRTTTRPQIYTLPTWSNGMSLDDNIVAERIDTDKTTSLNNRNTFGWAMDVHRYLSALQAGDKSKTEEDIYNNLIIPIFAEGDVFGNWEYNEKKNLYISPYTYRNVITVFEDLNTAYQALTKFQTARAKEEPEMDGVSFSVFGAWFMWSYGASELPLEVQAKLGAVARDDFRHRLRPLRLSMTTGTTNGMSFNTDALIGWCWLLLQRDFMEEITYQTCEAWDCDREVPSVGLASAHLKRGRTMRYCGQRCRTANNNKKNSELRHENEVLKAQLEALKGTQNAKDK